MSKTPIARIAVIYITVSKVLDGCHRQILDKEEKPH